MLDTKRWVSPLLVLSFAALLMVLAAACTTEIAEPAPEAAVATEEPAQEAQEPAQEGETSEQAPAPEVDAADPDPVAMTSDVPAIDLPAAGPGGPTGTIVAPAGVNVRTGPGTEFPVIGVSPQGDESQIIGVSEDGNWWVAVVPTADAEYGWIAAAYVDAANAEDVPVFATPPSPQAPDLNDAAIVEGQPYEIGGGTILYSASRVVRDGGRVYELEDVYSVPATPGSTPVMVANDAMQPALSPDRRTLAFHSTQHDKLGLGGHDLSTGERLRFSRFHEDSSPRWSPSGDRIVYATQKHPDHGDRRWRIYVTPGVHRERPAEMTYTPLGYGKDPDWHPSQESIIFKGCNDEGQQCGIYTMNADGSNRTLFTDVASDSLPRWFPDGSTVVFMSEGRDGNWEIYRANADGSDVTRLTNDPAPDGLPAVSPDGTQIAFISKRGGTWGLWVMPATGGEATLITPIMGDLPDWLVQRVDWPK